MAFTDQVEQISQSNLTECDRVQNLSIKVDTTYPENRFEIACKRQIADNKSTDELSTPSVRPAAPLPPTAARRSAHCSRVRALHPPLRPGHPTGIDVRRFLASPLEPYPRSLLVRSRLQKPRRGLGADTSRILCIL